MKKKIFALCLLLVSGALFTGCNETNGSGSGTCGDTKKDSGEKCDGTGADKCLSEVECKAKPLGPCVKEYQYSGAVDTCTAECAPVMVKGCEPAKCGNKELDAGETCDPKYEGFGDGLCPTEASCEAESTGCVIKKLAGSAAACTAKCVVEKTITEKKNGDGCCPEGATRSEDDDCVEPKKIGDACTNDAECKAGSGDSSARCLFYSGNTAAGGKKGMCTKSCTNKFGYCDAAGVAPGILTACVPLGGNTPQDLICAPVCQGDETVCNGRGDDIGCFKGLLCLPLKNVDATTDQVNATCTKAQEVADCGAGNECIEDTNLFADGSCLQSCADVPALPAPLKMCPKNTDCTITANDGTGICVPKCKVDADCRSEYQCSATAQCQPIGRKCEGSDECKNFYKNLEIPNADDYSCVDYGAPLGKRCNVVGLDTGGKPIGSSCDNVHECGGGKNALCLNYLNDLKICDIECKANADCGTGYKCVETTNVSGRKYNVCKKECDPADDKCSAPSPDGYDNKYFECKSQNDVENAAVNVCDPTSLPNTGALCQNDSQCVNGAKCLVIDGGTTSGGTCAYKGCSQTTANCPAALGLESSEQSCVTVGNPSGGNSENYCFASCGSDSADLTKECGDDSNRSEYRCIGADQNKVCLRK